MGKLALVAPAGTVMLGGTTANGLLDESDTVSPDDPALAERVSVPTLLDPPIKELDLAEMPVSAPAGATFHNVPPLLAPPRRQVPYMLPLLSNVIPEVGLSPSVADVKL